MMEEANLDIGKPHGQEDYCDSNPDFAVICSFIVQFGDKIDLELDIEQLKTTIENQSQLDDSLLDLHVKLLKKLRRYFVRDQWEKALIRFASEYSYEDAYEIEQIGYLKSRTSIKLNLLRRLLDAQFECDQKFKAAVNLCEADELRAAPVGRDICGNTYWQRIDNEGSLRVFLEEPLNYTIWKTVCKSPEELKQLIDNLDKIKEDKVKGQPMLDPYNPLPEIFPNIFQKDDSIKNDSPVKKESARTKKGRKNKINGKKSSPLPVLQEIEEENIDLTELKSDENCKSSQSNERQSMTNGKTNHLNCSLNSHCDTSIESQVRTTLDNLINKVVLSFEYIFRPLSRNNSTPPTTIKESVVESKPKKRQQIKKEKPKEETLPRRSSSRIQQLQMKKIAEQEEEIKKLVESKLKCPETSQDGTESNIKSRPQSPEDDFKRSKRKHRKGQSWRRGKGKKKLSWDKDDSDLSSVSSLTDSNDDFEDNDFTIKYDNDIVDDEFACEEEDTNIEPVIVKRARTARQSLGADDKGNLSIISTHEEDKPCERCDKSNDPEWVLLCDMCDEGYHTSCCVPPLMIVPDGDWFCPPCEHKMLLTKLNDLYVSIVEIVRVKELERKKRQRLRQTTIKKEPISNIYESQETLPEKRGRGFLNELNDPLAVQELDEICQETSSSYKYVDRTKSKPSRSRKANRRRSSYEDSEDDEDEGKNSIVYKKPRRTYSKRSISESDEEFDEESSESSVEIQPKARRARNSVSYRFQEYDELIKSAIRGDSYDEEEESSAKESSPEASNSGRGKDMATIEALAYQQENGLLNQDAPSVANDDASTALHTAATKKRPRKKARRLNDLDAASETENATSDESFQASSEAEAEEEDEDLTEADSYNESDTSVDELVSAIIPWKKKKKRVKQSSYYSDDSDYQPTRGRRAANARVSYKESTDDEDSEFGEKTKKISKKNTLSSGEESHESWKSSPNNVADSPNPAADSPNPVAGSPHPVAGSPHPVADSPHPIADSFHPIADSPDHPPFYEDEDELLNLN